MQSVFAAHARAPDHASKSVVAVLVFLVFADYLGSITGAGALLKMVAAALFGGVSIYYFGLSLALGQLPALLAMCYAVGCVLVSEPNAALAYELFKVLSFVMMLVAFQCLVRRGRDEVFGYSIAAITDGAVKAIDLCVKFNALVVLAQVVAGQDIVRFAGIPADAINTPQMAGRFSGLIINLPLWSSLLVLQFLLGDRRIFPDHARNLGPAKRVFLLGLLLLSGQKFAILFILGYMVLRMGRPLVLLAVFLGVAYAAYPFIREHPQVVDKLQQLDGLLDYGFQLLDRVDASDDFPLFGFLDIRVNSWIYGFLSLVAAPFGRGLGTWGDFSASLNEAIADPVVLAESYWSHIMVEQGVLVLGLLLLIWLSARALKDATWVFFAFLFITFWFTMGPSDYFWVQLVSLVFFGSRLAHTRDSGAGR